MHIKCKYRRAVCTHTWCFSCYFLLHFGYTVHCCAEVYMYGVCLQVYIVAMMQEQQKIRDKALRPKNQDEDEYGGGESLLNLVRPELASLSQNWLAALKDHAMLSLPAGT